MMIEFTIFGDPVAKGRPIVTKKGTYTPEKTRVAERSFQYQSIIFRPATPLEGPLALDIIFYCKIPKSFSKKKRELAMDEGILPVGRPDLDNLIKLAKDAMSGIFYRDDAQVVQLFGKKIYSDVPKINVRLWKLSEVLNREEEKK